MSKANKVDKKWALLLELLLKIVSDSNCYSEDKAFLLKQLISEVEK